MSKFLKHEVDYTDDHGSSDQQCSKCYYFMPAAAPGWFTRCKIVMGRIEQGGWCRKFKREEA